MEMAQLAGFSVEKVISSIHGQVYMLQYYFQQNPIFSMFEWCSLELLKFFIFPKYSHFCLLKTEKLPSVIKGK